MRKNGVVAILVGLGGCGGGGDPFVVPGPAEVERAAGTTALAQPCGADVDEGIDGTVDAHWTFEYLDGGRRERDIKRDLEDNVVEDQTFEYDNAGRAIAYDITSWVDGVSYRYIYRVLRDAFGRRLGSSTDGDGDGTLDIVETVTAWNESGLWTASTTVYGDETYTTVSTYDSHGRPVERRQTNSDGTPRGVTTFTYDDAARTRTSDIQNPTYRLRSTYRYDAEGRLLGLVFDFGDDVPDEGGGFELTYDGDRLATWTEHDGFGMRRTTYAYCE